MSVTLFWDPHAITEIVTRNRPKVDLVIRVYAQTKSVAGRLKSRYT